MASILSRTRTSPVPAAAESPVETVGGLTLSPVRLLDALPANVVVTDPDLRVVHTNPAAAERLRALGVSADTVVGGNVPRGVTASPAVEVAVGGATLRVGANAVIDEAGRPAAYVVVFEDVSEVRAAEADHARAGTERAAVAEEILGNVQGLASATEQMTVSITEIAASASGAADTASHAVTRASEMADMAAKLAESTTRIAGVATYIRSIAEQTNLLALNATIEAARAGDAGRGFAVVANEVKELAKGTTSATEEVGTVIAAIESDAQAMVAAIADITDVVGRIDDLQSTIATAVEEQTAVTQQMTVDLSVVAHTAARAAQQ